MLFAPTPAIATPARDGLIEVEVRDREELARLTKMGLDLWTEHPHVGTIRGLTSAAERDALRSRGLRVRSLDIDVWADAAAEHARVVDAPAAADEFFADFRELAVIDAQLDTWATDDPSRVSIVGIGTSIEGRSIRGVRISSDATPRPGLLINAGQHAREWLSITSALWVVDALITGADEAPYAALLEQFEVVIVPVVNPDGYVYTWSDDRYWRKNRRDGHGVDTNRNFAEGWGGEGAGFDPLDENYLGSAAFSEPESQALRDWVMGHPDPRAYLDLHCFGQLVLYPWGHVGEPTDDDAMFAAQSQQMVEAMAALFDAEYTPLQGVDLYPAAGNSIDWAYGQIAIPSYAMELRPNFDDRDGFVVAPDLIEPAGEEVLAALVALAQSIGGNEPDPSGTSSGGDTSGGDVTGEFADGTRTTGELATSSATDGTSAAPYGTAEGDETRGSDAAAASGDSAGCGCRGGTDPGVMGLGALALGLRRRRRASPSP